MMRTYKVRVSVDIEREIGIFDDGNMNEYEISDLIHQEALRDIEERINVEIIEEVK